MKHIYQLTLALILCFFSTSTAQETTMYLTVPNYSKMMDSYFESMFSREVNHQLRPFYQTFKRTFIKGFQGFTQINLNNPLFCITETPNTYRAIITSIGYLFGNKFVDEAPTFLDIYGLFVLRCNPFAYGGIINQYLFVFSLVQSTLITNNQSSDGVFLLWVVSVLTQILTDFAQSLIILLYPFMYHLDIYNLSYTLAKLPNTVLLLLQVYFMAQSIEFTQGKFTLI